MAVKRAGGIDRAATAEFNRIDTALGTKANTNNVYKHVAANTRYGWDIEGVNGGVYIITMGSTAHSAEFWVYSTTDTLLANFTTSSGTYTYTATGNFARVYSSSATVDSTFTWVQQTFYTTTIGSLTALTSSGNYATAGGTAGNYTAGDYAIAICASAGGGGGGGGGGYWTGSYGSGFGYGETGGAGGYGTAVSIDTPFALTGTYSFTIGAAGQGGTAGTHNGGLGAGNGNAGQAGNAGGSTNAFNSGTLAGGNGGSLGRGTNSAQGQWGPLADGTPTNATNMSFNSKIFTNNALGGQFGNYGQAGGRGQGGQANSGGTNGGSGGSGVVYILKWQP